MLAVAVLGARLLVGRSRFLRLAAGTSECLLLAVAVLGARLLVGRSLAAVLVLPGPHGRELVCL